MWSWLFGEAGEARRLNKDSKAILETTRYGQNTDRQRNVALLTRRTLAEAREAGGETPAQYGPQLASLRMWHREARRASRDRELTAYTLCIIYLRAEQLGDAAAPARAQIDAFLSDWEHIDDDTVSA